MNSHIKYGHYRGGDVKAQDKSIAWAAGQVVKARSGRFVYNNAGAITLCADGADEIMGHAEESEGTPATGSAVSGGIIVDPSAIYRIPVGAGTYTAAMLGKTCDLKVTANIQGADLTASVDDVFIIVGGDIVNNEWVDVMLSQNERSQNGV